MTPSKRLVFLLKRANRNGWLVTETVFHRRGVRLNVVTKRGPRTLK